jgi:hypothetical protein
MRTLHRAAIAGLLCTGLTGLYLFAQEEPELQVPHAECVFLGPQAQKFTQAGPRAARQRDYNLSRQTAEIAARLAPVKDSGERAAADPNNVIDRHLSQLWKDAAVTPAARTNDYEFIRRVTLDLTGRVPTASGVQQFVANSDAGKRQALVDELIASEAFTDKWTMYLGDLLKNTLRTTQVVRFAEGRNAFHQWIYKAVAENKPFDRLAAELISATGENSYEQGELNWLVGGFVTGGPVQDIWDQTAVNTATTFLGLGHMNCVGCHDGRRHLDTLSLWGKSATRLQFYQLSAFFAGTDLVRTRIGAQANPYYWSVRPTTAAARREYNLGTTTGNRPERSAVGTVRQIAPEYPFSGATPASGENRRAALARFVTGDPQFARNAVNRIWKEFMVKAFVEPVDQFDPARLDPDNPPPSPWTLQPNQPRLLNELAQEFAGPMKFDLRKLMRTIVLSEAYQLSSRYSGDWNPAWEDLYARKLVRRLMAEEVHDAVVQTSNIPVTYNVAGIGRLSWAMQLPDVVNVPGGAAATWLDSFMRGNREDEDRRREGSVLQVLNLMNDSFVLNRTRAGGATSSNLARQALNQGSDDQLVNLLFLNVLSRMPTDAEKATALSALRQGNRQQGTENLLWALYNKVDFFFNY